MIYIYIYTSKQKCPSDSSPFILSSFIISYVGWLKALYKRQLVMTYDFDCQWFLSCGMQCEYAINSQVKWTSGQDKQSNSSCSLSLPPLISPRNVPLL